MVDAIVLIGAFVWVVLALLVATDTIGHPENGFIWFIIVLITGIFGLVFYLLWRRPRGDRGSVACSECGADNVADANYCHNCGESLPSGDDTQQSEQRESSGMDLTGAIRHFLGL